MRKVLSQVRALASKWSIARYREQEFRRMSEDRAAREHTERLAEGGRDYPRIQP